MSNIVPKNHEDGRLGRLERRWLELHTKLASVESVKLEGVVQTPASNELHIDASGNLKLGNDSVALQGDVDQLTALLNAFLSETGDDGVGEIINSFGTTYDTLRELIDGLETLTSYAQISYVDDQISSVASTISAVEGRVSANENDISSINTTISNLELNDLVDVALGTLTSGNVIKYDGTRWRSSEDINYPPDKYGSSAQPSYYKVQVNAPTGEFYQTPVYISTTAAGATTIAAPTLSVGSAANKTNTIYTDRVWLGDMTVTQSTYTIGSFTHRNISLNNVRDIKRDTAYETANTPGIFERVSNLENAPAPSSSLAGLSDVTLGTLTAATHDGAALVYNASTSEWIAGEVDIASLKNTVDGLVQGGGAPSSGNQDLLQVSDGSGAFQERGIALEQTQTGSTFDTILYASSLANLLTVGKGSSGNQLKTVNTDSVTFATGDQATPAVTLTATASTLNFKGSALASISYVNSVAGSGVNVTGSTLQFEVSDGNGDLTPIGLSATVNGSTLTGLIPALNEQTDLGSATNKFKDLYLSGNSIYLGDATISSTASTLSLGGSAIAFANQLNDYALSSSVTTLSQSVSTSLTSLASSITSIKGDITTLGGSITSLSSSVSTAQSDILSLQSSSSTLSSSISATNTKLSTVISSAGLTASGTYTANSAATFISGATSLYNADVLLNDQLETVTSDLASLQSTVSTIQSGSADDVTALQNEIDATQSGAGLGTGGSYTANSSSNYITAVSSLKAADDALDAQIKANADAISTNASSITSVLSRVTTLEANDLDDLVISSASGALSFDSATNTLTLTDASITAGTADSLAGEVALLLSGDVTSSAVTFTSGGTYTISTSLSTSLANTISSIQSTLSGKQDTLTVSTGLSQTGDTISLNESHVRGLFSASGDLAYNGTLGQFSVSTYSSFDSDFSGKDTDDLSEGASNLYYTDARVSSYLTTNSYATESYVGTQVANLVDSAPAALDTLNELAAALGDDPNFATTVTNSIASKQPLLTVVDGGTLGSSLALTSSGTLTFTGPVSSSVISLFSEGDNVSITSAGTISSSIASLSTDDLSEGSSNLYYTDARAQASLSVTDNGGDGSLSYDSSTGVFSYTGPSSSEVRAHFTAGGDINISGGTISVTTYKSSDFATDLGTKDTDDLVEGASNLYYTDARSRSSVSVTDNGGDGSLSYNSSTGVISYTGPNDAETRAHFSAGGDLNYSNATGVFSVTTYKSSDFDTDLATKDTDNLSEGASNLYYTDARARSSLSSGGDLSYDSSTGVFSFTERTDAEVRGLISVSDSGGDGSLSYDNSTGVLTYSGPSASEVRAHFTAGSNIDISSGVISLSSSVNATDIAVSGEFTVEGHILEMFDHGLITSSHSSTADLGSVTSDVIYHSADLGGLDNGSFI